MFRQLFLRALNDNQILLLENINGDNKSLNSLLEELTKEFNKPISTLKLNARILKNLELIKYGERNNPEPVRLTRYGEIVLRYIQTDSQEVNI